MSNETEPTAASTSSAARWTEGEKLGVLFSLIKADGHVNWSQAWVPPGRSLKGVKCMIDVERKKMDTAHAGGTGAGGETGDGAPTAATGTGTPGAGKAANKRKRGPAKKDKAVEGNGAAAAAEDGGNDDTPSKPPPKKRGRPAKKQAAAKSEPASSPPPVEAPESLEQTAEKAIEQIGETVVKTEEETGNTEAKLA